MSITHEARSDQNAEPQTIAQALATEANPRRDFDVAAVDREREKIERNLHDGAQQRLIALRLKLELAAQRLADANPAGAAMLIELAEQVEVTIDEVRAFARGVFPALLAQTGLGESLRSLGRDAGLPTIVNADGLGRYRPEVETSVYFSCSEALQNAGKHARGASQVVISVWEQDGLRFTVADDGAGFDPERQPRGSGLSNLRDRLAAVGGTISVESAPGQGTTVSGWVDVD